MPRPLRNDPIGVIENQKSTLTREDSMGSKKRDFSIFNRFEFERQPVAVKFLFKKPEEIKPLNKTLAFLRDVCCGAAGRAFLCRKR